MYIGVPAVSNRKGAVRVFEVPLDEHEQQRFAESAALLKSYQAKVDDFQP